MLLSRTVIVGREWSSTPSSGSSSVDYAASTGISNTQPMQNRHFGDGRHSFPSHHCTNQLPFGNSGHRYQQKVWTQSPTDPRPHDDHPRVHLRVSTSIPYCTSARFAQEPASKCFRCRGLDQISPPFVFVAIPSAWSSIQAHMSNCIVIYAYVLYLLSAKLWRYKWDFANKPDQMEQQTPGRYLQKWQSGTTS